MVKLSGICKVSYILCVLLIFLLNDAIAQDTYEGQVMEKDSMTAISSVSVTLVKEKIVVKTNARGYFRIDSENGVPNDTLVFTSVGYLTYNVAVSDFVNNSFIIMNPSSTALKQVDVTVRNLKTLRLNAFGLQILKKDRDMSVPPFKPYIPKPYTTTYIYAKLFSSPEPNFTLMNIEFGRTVFDDPFYPILPTTKSNPRTKFFIHIMSVESQSGKPLKSIFTKQISLTENGKWVTIDLSKDNIDMPSKQFFIAIEWLRIPYNEIVQLGQTPRVRRLKKNGDQITEDVSQYKVLYQPALVEYKHSNKPRSYIKDIQGNWQEEAQGLDVALSATIKF